MKKNAFGNSSSILDKSGFLGQHASKAYTDELNHTSEPLKNDAINGKGSKHDTNPMSPDQGKANGKSIKVIEDRK